jgi:hypothetical protein
MFKLDCRSTDEKHDCTVRTLSNIINISYNNAHDILEFYGRKPNEVFYWHIVMDELKNDFEKVFDLHDEQNIAMKWIAKNTPKIPVFRKTYTVSQALKTFNKGKYAFLVYGHVFAVIDGNVIDTFRHGKQMKRVLAVYKYKR